MLADEYVVAMLDGHSSRYQGRWLSKVAEEMDKVYTEVVYPSAEHESCLEKGKSTIKIKNDFLHLAPLATVSTLTSST